MVGWMDYKVVFHQNAATFSSELAKFRSEYSFTMQCLKQDEYLEECLLFLACRDTASQITEGKVKTSIEQETVFWLMQGNTAAFFKLCLPTMPRVL